MYIVGLHHFGFLNSLTDYFFNTRNIIILFIYFFSVFTKLLC